MRFGLDVAQQRLEFDEIVARTKLAEELGFDGAWGFDHFVPMYGEGPGNCFEGMTTLAALASLTSRIRLGLLVAGVTYRHPSVFATEALTIDHASRGRLEIGIGAAWFASEHRQLGIEFPSTRERFDLLEDQLEILTRLFTGENVTYTGRRISLDRAQLLPRPVQKPHPPIWIGGSGRQRTLPLVARFADAWHTWAGDDYADLSAEIDRLCEANERDPRSVLRACDLSLSGSLDDCLRKTEQLRELGVGYLTCGWPGQGRQRVEAYVPRLLAEFSD
jgi:alkanesulfonate monooxygenase SsuD/methylene tetrahydromethanopterin reductase-like flavin-dependent oxidoreductase (luciferase family)